MNQSRYNSDEKMHGSPDIYNQFNLQHRDDQMDDDIDLQVRDSKKVSVD